jgi:hypothetical protein
MGEVFKSGYHFKTPYSYVTLPTHDDSGVRGIHTWKQEILKTPAKWFAYQIHMLIIVFRV